MVRRGLVARYHLSPKAASRVSVVGAEIQHVCLLFVAQLMKPELLEVVPVNASTPAAEFPRPDLEVEKLLAEGLLVRHTRQ